MPPLDAGTVRGRPANENDPTTSMMMARLQRQPSNSAYLAAFLMSLAWVFGWAIIYSGTLLQQPPTEMVRSLALLLLPIGIIWTIAYLLWRAQQLRQVSEVLMHSAMRLIRPQDIAADGLTSIAQAVRSEVDLLVGGVEHAVQRATVLEDIVHKEIAAIERAFGGNEERIRGLVTGLENQRAALHQASMVVGNESAPMLARLESNTHNLDLVISNAQTTLARLEHGLKNSAVELGRSIDEVSQRAALAGSEIGGQTAQMERMSSMLVTELRTFSGHLQEQIQTLATAANQINSETSNFGRNVQGLETNVVSVLKQSVDHLTGVNAELVRTIDRVSQGSADKIRQAAEEMAEVVQGSSGNITYHLKSASSEIASLIERTSATAANQLEQGRDLVTQGLQNVAGDFLDKIARSRGDLINYVDQTSTQIVGSIDDAANRLGDRFAGASVQFLTGMDQTANQILSQLNSSGIGLAGKVEETTTRLFEQIGDKAALITSKLDDTSNGVFNRLEEQAEYVNTNMEETSNRIFGTLEQRANALGSNISDNALRVLNSIEMQSSDITGKLEKTSTFVAEKIDTASGLVHNRLETVGTDVVGQMQQTGNTISELLISTSGTISSHLKETSDIVARQMQESGIALAQNIESSGGLVTDRLISVSGEFIQKVGMAREDLFELLERSSSTLQTRLQDTTQQLNSKLDETSSTITDRVISVTNQLTGRLDNASTQLSGLLDSTENRIGTQLETATTELTALFTANTKMLTEQLDQTSTNVTNSFADTAVRVTQQVTAANTLMAKRLEDTSSEVATQLDSAGNSMFSRIENTARELGQRFDFATDLLEKVTGDISGRLSSTGEKFEQTLSTTSNTMVGNLDRASVAFQEGLAQTTMQISGRFEQDTGLLVDRIDRAVREFDTAANTSGAKLDEAHRKFSKHVEVANGYLADQLATSASTIDERLESVSMDLTGKLEVTGGKISERLEDVSELVEKSIEHFNTQMETVMSTRKSALDGLIDNAAKRVQEIDKVMNGYLGMIEESLASAESRSKEISKIIADQTSIAVGNLEQEIRRLEASSGGQITQASRVLREQHERAMAAMNEMLASTASDFQQTAQDMRITAQQVVKDIDSARADLKRAIFDLPEETKSNADAMRRVVADQIAALNTLADVVRRQSANVDFSGPGITSPRGGREPLPGK